MCKQNDSYEFLSCDQRTQRINSKKKEKDSRNFFYNDLIQPNESFIGSWLSRVISEGNPDVEFTVLHHICKRFSFVLLRNVLKISFDTPFNCNHRKRSVDDDVHTQGNYFIVIFDTYRSRIFTRFFFSSENQTNSTDPKVGFRWGKEGEMDWSRRDVTTLDEDILT